MRDLKEYWCKEKAEFCRPNGTNEAYQEVTDTLAKELGLIQKTFEDLAYTVIAQREEGACHVDFLVYEDEETEDYVFRGSVKWDGCSNWDIPEGHYYFHFCEMQHAINLGILLGRLYELAAEMMPEHANEILYKSRFPR